MALNLKPFSSCLYKGLGEQIVKYRKKRRCTQKQLSELIGVSVDTLSSYENGRVSIPFDKVLLMAIVLGIGHIHFGVKPYRSMPISNEVTFHVDMGICEEVKRALETKPVDMRKPLIYSMIKQMRPYEDSGVGGSILDLYLQYCYSLKDNDGQSITEEAYVELRPKGMDEFEHSLEPQFYPRPHKPSDMQEGSVKVSTE